MKDLVKRTKSFMTFDYPLQTAFISARFANTHKKLQTEIPGWSTTATRQKMISDYWFNYVAGHFAIMVGLPATVVVLFHATFEHSDFFLLGVLVAGLLSYLVLYLFHYRPWFSSIFLPRLETVKETYERGHIERLGKCRQSQLSNFSLTLFFYVFSSTNNIHSLKCDDESAILLMKLYGVDPGSMKKNLELILASGKRKNLTERKITEIRNRFTETYTFLEELKFTKGIEKLKDLEARFFAGFRIL